MVWVKWNEFIGWLDKFPKFQDSVVDTGRRLQNGEPKTIEAVPFGIEGNDEVEVKKALMEHIVDRIGNAEHMDIWVRVMPEVAVLSGSKEVFGEDHYMGYARIAWFPKGL